VRVRVEFRFNAETGEVELFQVDDMGREVPEADHDARHEEIAHRLGRLLDRRPGIDEMVNGAGTPPVPETPAADPEVVPEPARERRTARE
jgi:hypothetical protein